MEDKAVLSFHTKTVRYLALLPDGSSGSDDKAIKIWSTSTFHCELSFIDYNLRAIGYWDMSGSADKTVNISDMEFAYWSMQDNMDWSY